MKFLTDENISPVILDELRYGKHNVYDLKEKKLRGISDQQIAQIAKRENRIVITHDVKFASSLLTSTSTKFLLITFSHKRETRSIMKLIGKYISENSMLIFKKRAKIHIKLDADKLKIIPLE